MGEDLYELPKGWVWITLEDISAVMDVDHKMPKAVEEGVIFISPKDFYNLNGIDFQNAKKISEEDFQRLCRKCKPEIGDIIYSRIGTIGKVRKVPKNTKFHISYSLCLIKPFHESLRDNDCLYWFLQAPYILEKALSKKRSIGVPDLGLGDIRKFDIPLPPLAEQPRIVAKIEELFTQLDAGVELLKKVKAKLKRYRQAVLKAAVEGNLTKEWREANQGELEPASELLERILKLRREKWEAEQMAKMKAQGKTPKDDSWKLKYQEPIAPDTSDLPDLPVEWCWANAQQIGEVQLGRQRSPKNRSKDYPTKYIRAANITENGLDFSDVLDMEFEPHERQRYLLKIGDIVLSEASGSPSQVGKPAIWRGQLQECCFQNTVIRLRSFILSNEYLLVVFKTFYVIAIFARIAAGVGINHLSANKFSIIPVPIPPLKEQIQIVEEIERHLSVIDQLEKTINANLKRAERLRQTILKQAFEGKLVPQDPNDEPAEKLLERIKAEKAKREADKKPKRQSTIKSKQPRKSKTTATQLELKLDD